MLLKTATFFFFPFNFSITNKVFTNKYEYMNTMKKVTVKAMKQLQYPIVSEIINI